MRIPRKIKKKIPKGLYCYTYLNPTPDGLGFYIKSCPYYKHDSEIFGYCNLVKYEVMDQCKECNCKLDLSKINMLW